MKRLSRGTVVLAASVALWSCSGDPTDSFRGTPEEITASPTTLFVTRGESKPVVVEVVDAQGNPLDVEVTPSGGTGITVALDTTYLPTTATTGELTYQRQFIVTANELVSTSFTFTAGGVTRDIAVKVIPGTTDIPLATVVSTGPDANDSTVLTVPAPFLFPAEPEVTFGTLQAIVVARSSDGRSITILPPPGAIGNGTATVTVDYLPSASLATTTDVAFTINPIPTPLPGTDAPATAPTIVIPPPGSSGGFWDAGNMAAADCGQLSGVPCQLYKFTLADSTTLDMTLEGSNAADLGLYFINADDGTDLDQFCDDLGRDEVPESCELVFGPGNILMSVVSFGPFYPENDPNPDWVSVRISNPAP